MDTFHLLEYVKTNNLKSISIYLDRDQLNFFHQLLTLKNNFKNYLTRLQIFQHTTYANIPITIKYSYNN